MKIYTKTGDNGLTSLVGGKRVSKCCERVESYGTIDELNSYIGVLLTYCEKDKDCLFLTKVQNALFEVGNYLATDMEGAEGNAESEKHRCVVTEKMVEDVEQEIDRLSDKVPPFKGFVLPGGTRGAAFAHVCRTVCRRAERCILRLVEDDTEVDKEVIAYVNRLSDYFFVLARKLNADEDEEDVLWTRSITRKC